MKNKTFDFHLRMTKDDFEYLSNQSKIAGLSKAQFVRKRLRGYEIKPPVTGDVSEVLVQLGRIGNNINQLAREVHTYKVLDEGALLSNIDSLVSQIDKLRKDILYQNIFSED